MPSTPISTDDGEDPIMDGFEDRLRRLSDQQLDAELGRVLSTLRGSVPNRSALRAVASTTSGAARGRRSRAALASGTLDVADLLRRQALVSRELRRRRETVSRASDAVAEGAVVLPFRPRRDR